LQTQQVLIAKLSLEFSNFMKSDQKLMLFNELIFKSQIQNKADASITKERRDSYYRQETFKNSCLSTWAIKETPCQLLLIQIQHLLWRRLSPQICSPSLA